MSKFRVVAIACMALVLASSPAFAYKRDVPSAPAVSDDAGEGDVEAEGESPAGRGDEGGDEVPDFHTGPSGKMVWGYVLLGVGGAAAIAGSTMIAASDEDVLGACVAGGGAVMSLVGSLMLMIGNTGYSVGPAIDPKHGTYGVAVAANF